MQIYFWNIVVKVIWYLATKETENLIEYYLKKRKQKKHEHVDSCVVAWIDQRSKKANDL